MKKKLLIISSFVIISVIIILISIKLKNRSIIQPRGMVLGLYAGIPDYDYREELKQIAETGATCVNIQALYFMETGTSCTIYSHPTNSPTEFNLRQTFKEAKANRLRVMFFPTINIKGEANNAKWWRGNIKPINWDLWWQNYTNFNVRLAQIAQEEGIEWYSVGTEMTSTHQFKHQWQKLISEVRKVFKGKITYSINFDSHDSFDFGNSLDVIGINTYDPIAKSTRYPTAEQIQNSWWWIIIKARTLQARFNRPVMITELGYPSVEGAHTGPWDFRSHKPCNPTLQNFLLKEALSVLQNWYDGEAVFYYLYGENLSKKPVGGITDRTYAIWGKPSELTLKTYFALPIYKYKQSNSALIEARHYAIIQTIASHLRKHTSHKKTPMPIWIKQWLIEHPTDGLEAEKIVRLETKR